MTRTDTGVDRAAAVRRALRELVAENGLHGASMSSVARRAGVATGTAYVHYESKDDLVYATYVEAKTELGEAVAAAVDPAAPPEERFHQIWRAVYDHLSTDPARARFLSQIEESPYSRRAHELVMAEGDRLSEEASRSDMVSLLVPLPFDILFSLGLGPAIRLVASGIELSDGELETLIDSCWKAITV